MLAQCVSIMEGKNRAAIEPTTPVEMLTATYHPTERALERDGFKDSNDKQAEIIDGEMERPRSHIRGMLHANAGNILKGNTIPTAAGESSPRAGVFQQMERHHQGGARTQPP